MRRPRSIRARLITLCVITLTLIFVCFAFYTYLGFKTYLMGSLQQALLRRAHQIASTILSEMPHRGEAYVGSEIQARYAPELNERIIRISDMSGRVIYASKNTSDEQPMTVAFTGAHSETKPVHLETETGDGHYLQVVALGYTLSDGAKYIVEVGAPEDEVFSALEGLLFTLMLGFPIFIGLTSGLAYVLLGRALHPVDEIVQAAERITSQNLSRRLPVRETGDEVERLTQTLNRMIERLEESFLQTSRFSADASHELRTPLTIMRGELEALLKDDKLSEEHAEQIGSILEEAERLTQIIEGLLTISRLDSGETQMGKDMVDLSALATTTAEQMAPLAEDKVLSLNCRVTPGIVIEANQARIKQVLVNLLDNAIKYTPEGGKLTLSVRGETDWAYLEIADNGIGISQEALPHVFERFYRSNQLQVRRARGTGLGLSMVQSIVEGHHGTVKVESSENEGSLFSVRLPRPGANMKAF